MKRFGLGRILLAVALAVLLAAGVTVVSRKAGGTFRQHAVAYFVKSNGIFPGDEVRILGVPVGKIDSIEPQPDRVKIAFWYDSRYKVPVDAKAVILSPSLVAVRALQLTPVYTDGPTMPNNSVIPLERTAVPVEYDDFREQLKRLTDMLEPAEPGGVSTLGNFVNTAADNLRGQGSNIRESIVEMSEAFAVLGDHSEDLFGSVKNVSILISALQNSRDLLRHLNQNLAAATELLANNPTEVGDAIADIDAVVGDVQHFVADNRESLGTTTDKLGAVSQALVESLDDIKQTLHIGAPLMANFANIYQPAQATLTGALAVNNFANPVQFLCSAVQAASRRGSEEAAKLCMQYLAPIMKNRQFNFPPIGLNPFVGASARPNELTYSEDWLRPDYVPPAQDPVGGVGSSPAPPENVPISQGDGSGRGEQNPHAGVEGEHGGDQPQPPDEGDELRGMMLPAENGS